MKTFLLFVIAVLLYVGFDATIQRLDKLHASLLVMHEQKNPIREPGLQ